MAEATSTKPYLLRALYEWCVDNGFTPYLSVIVDGQTHVPMEYVRDGEIVLNIGPLATSRLHMGNETIECTARFSGMARDLLVPVSAVAAIYARENGQGMSFETATADKAVEAGESPPEGERGGEVPGHEHGGESERPDPPKPGGRPSLRRVK